MENTSTTRVVSLIENKSKLKDNDNVNIDDDSLHKRFDSFVTQGSDEWFPGTKEEMRELIKFYRNQAC